MHDKVCYQAGPTSKSCRSPGPKEKCVPNRMINPCRVWHCIATLWGFPVGKPRFIDDYSTKFAAKQLA